MTLKRRSSLDLRCRCGATTLEVVNVAPEVASRVTCHCEGCRSFAARIDPTVLDTRGGTERFQVSPATVHITSGEGMLRCLQQTRGGALRWYTACCHSTVGLMLESPRVPFIALDVQRVEQASDVERLLGPMRTRVNLDVSRRERRGLKADVRSLLSMLTHLAPLTAAWWWRGDARRSPFRDPKTGRPIAEVERAYEAAPLGAGCR